MPPRVVNKRAAAEQPDAMAEEVSDDTVHHLLSLLHDDVPSDEEDIPKPTDPQRAIKGEKFHWTRPMRGYANFAGIMPPDTEKAYPSVDAAQMSFKWVRKQREKFQREHGGQDPVPGDVKYILVSLNHASMEDLDSMVAKDGIALYERKVNGVKPNDIMYLVERHNISWEQLDHLLRAKDGLSAKTYPKLSENLKKQAKKRRLEDMQQGN